MTPEITITLVILSICLYVITTMILRKDLVSIKYSLLWYFIATIVLLMAIFSPLFATIAHALGLATTSNIIIGIFLALLVFLTLSLTIIISLQNKKIILLIQELSLLKSKHKNQTNQHHDTPPREQR